MNWYLSRGNIHSELIDWLQINEWQHVSLTSRFVHHNKPKINNSVSDQLWIRKKNNRICGGMYISSLGIILPAFDVNTLEKSEISELHKLLLRVEPRITSVMGLASRVHFISQLLETKPQETLNFRILTCNNPSIKNQCHTWPLVIRPANLSDLDLLWPLERAYLLEEVLKKTDTLNERNCRQLFAKSLKNQLVFCATLKNYPLAKANTNAKGWTYYQIGGVFVVPQFRNLGIGRAVVFELLKTIQSKHRKSCLFVKESNTFALRLYLSLGFQDMDKFCISYWRIK